MRVNRKVKLHDVNTGLSMPKSHLNARCEFALMRGYVVSVKPQDLSYVLGYISSAILCDDTYKEVAQNILDEIKKYHKVEDVKFYCISTVHGMPQIALLVDDEDSEIPLPEDACDLVNIPECKIGGSAYWFSYVYNFAEPLFSEWGDTFYEDACSGFIHRVS